MAGRLAKGSVVLLLKRVKNTVLLQRNSSTLDLAGEQTLHELGWMARLGANPAAFRLVHNQPNILPLPQGSETNLRKGLGLNPGRAET